MGMRPLFLASVLLLAGCGPAPGMPPRHAPGIGAPASITVTSRTFGEGSRLPVDATCDGSDLVPELVFSSPPDATKSLAVYVEDPDAIAGLFTHMIAFNLAPDLRTLPSAPDLAAAGEAARFGLNDFQTPGYRGPCPPKHERHRYRYRVVALDTMLSLPEGATRAQIDAASDGHVLGEGTLTGHFGR